MNRLLKIAGGAALVAGIGVAIITAAAYAQETPAGQPTSTLSDYVDQMWNAVASKLGVERSALDTAMKDAGDDVTAQMVDDGKITQEQADLMKSHIEDGPGFGIRGFGMMMGRRGGHWGGPMGGGMCDQAALAEQLGMTTDELTAELKAGKTIAELAEEKGVDLEAARIEAMKKQMQQAVEAGTLTQEQADWMLQGMEQGLMPGAGGFGGGMHGGFGGGMHGRFGGMDGFRGFWGPDVPGDQSNQSNQTTPSNQGNL